MGIHGFGEHFPCPIWIPYGSHMGHLFVPGFPADLPRRALDRTNPGPKTAKERNRLGFMWKMMVKWDVRRIKWDVRRVSWDVRRDSIEIYRGLESSQERTVSIAKCLRGVYHI